jgi:hypothetical protein
MFLHFKNYLVNLLMEYNFNSPNLLIYPFPKDVILTNLKLFSSISSLSIFLYYIKWILKYELNYQFLI